MGLLPDVVAGAPIQASWGNTVRNQSVMPFTNAAERTAQWVGPPEGALSYLRDVDRIEFYDGAAWRPLAVAARSWTTLADVLLAADGPLSLPAIPATYTHLQLVLSLRGVATAATDSAMIRVNGDTGANYFDGNNSNGAAGSTRSGFFFCGVCSAASGSYFSSHVIDFLSYTAARNKAGIGRYGAAEAGNAWTGAFTWLWFNPAAITQLDVFGLSGAVPTWKAGSRATLLAI